MIHYRKPRPDEAEVFAALHVRCWREAYPAYLPAALMASFSVERRLPIWQARLGNIKLFVLGAYVDGVAVGFVMSGPPDEKHIEDQDGHLWGIYILQAHKGKGIGRALVQRAHADWVSCGGKTMTVGVLAENLAARRFYEKLGARFVHDGHYIWDGHKLKDCLYIWDDITKT